MHDITIGQYYPAKSVLHALDPRTKLVGTFIYILSLFMVKDFIGYGVAVAVLAFFIVLSHVPFTYMVRGLKAVLFLLFFTAALNVFWTPGDILYSWKFIAITKQGIYKAVYMMFRLVLLILSSSLMTLTTTPNQLMSGMEKIFAPLQKFKIPVHELAMMMSIALRFIPVLLEEADKIRKAQLARGADFTNGSLIQRVKSMIPLLVPLFVSASRRADELALAMEARCYHGGEGGRSYMNPLHYQRKDIAAYSVLLVYLAGIGLLRTL